MGALSEERSYDWQIRVRWVLAVASWLVLGTLHIAFGLLVCGGLGLLLAMGATALCDVAFGDLDSTLVVLVTWPLSTLWLACCIKFPDKTKAGFNATAPSVLWGWRQWIVEFPGSARQFYGRTMAYRDQQSDAQAELSLLRSSGFVRLVRISNDGDETCEGYLVVRSGEAGLAWRTQAKLRELEEAELARSIDNTNASATCHSGACARISRMQQRLEGLSTGTVLAQGVEERAYDDWLGYQLEEGLKGYVLFGHPTVGRRVSSSLAPIVRPSTTLATRPGESARWSCMSCRRPNSACECRARPVAHREGAIRAPIPTPRLPRLGQWLWLRMRQYLAFLGLAPPPSFPANSVREWTLISGYPEPWRSATPPIGAPRRDVPVHRGLRQV